MKPVLFRLRENGLIPFLKFDCDGCFIVSIDFRNVDPIFHFHLAVYTVLFIEDSEN